MVGGGLVGSNGRAFNQVVKKRGYEYEKIDPIPQEYIDRGFQELLDREKAKEVTYFISGHRDITEDEFERNYKITLEGIVNEVPDCRFVVGDCQGADIMAQNYLLDVLDVDPDRITVYYVGDRARNLNPKVCNIMCGFENDREKDAAMTAASSVDIAFVRNNTEISGTAENILRRHMLA